MSVRWTLKELEALVRELRSRWGIANDLRPNLLEILQVVFPREFPGFQLRIVPDDQIAHALAFVDNKLNQITVRQSIADAAARREPRALYILAEEIGHFLFKHRHGQFRKADASMQYTNAKVGADEREARKFAAIFLAPAYLCDGCEEAKEIENRFPLSGWSAELRIGELEKLRGKRSLFTEDSSPEIVDFLKQAELRGRRAPSAEGTRFELELDLDMPPTDAAPIVDLAHSSEKARYRIWGYAPDRNLHFVELRGSLTSYRLPFVRNKIFVQPLSGGLPSKIVAVDWVELKSTSSGATSKSAQIIAAVAAGYDPNPCDVCRNYTVKKDGNRVTCDTCGETDGFSGQAVL